MGVLVALGAVAALAIAAAGAFCLVQSVRPYYPKAPQDMDDAELAAFAVSVQNAVDEARRTGQDVVVKHGKAPTRAQRLALAAIGGLLLVAAGAALWGLFA